MPSLCCINVANVVFWSSRHNDFERHGGLGNTTENACTVTSKLNFDIGHLGRMAKPTSAVQVVIEQANHRLLTVFINSEFNLDVFVQVVRARVWLSVVGAQHCLPQAH
ncbi:hypothetical protein CYMTET_13242 [Cymbomonas tetramitiformis]|uniref:Uncharacterized protein n=1 Tax=Cymbomonas tetramitiformis TaxID=36881 RepID=A0AAE0GIU1_9CHLO|nr:hypothetical protein CYMTET_13242 [Cymbomonas tetramitiformis]